MQFPKLISGQVAQSKAYRTLPGTHMSFHFEGFTRQSRQNTHLRPLVWRLKYSDLKAEEAMQLRKFVEGLPASEAFAFEDPWTGQEFLNCRLANPTIIIRCDTNKRYQVELEVLHAG